MKSASGAMQSFLSVTTEMLWYDLFTITLLDGTVVRFTTADRDITYLGSVYSSGPLLVERETIKWKTGLEVDTMVMTFKSIGTDVIDGLAIMQGMINGNFDNALVQVNRLYTSTFGDWTNGVISMFTGNFGDIIEIGRSLIRVDVVSKLHLLNRQVPSHVYQPACAWTLFDAGCTLNKAAHAVNGTVASGSNNKYGFSTSLVHADQYFQLGLIAFNSGLNTGVTRTVRLYVNAGGYVTIYKALPFMPVIGDGFKIYAGCDKRLSTCDSKFFNSANFFGMPNVPAAETAV